MIFEKHITYVTSNQEKQFWDSIEVNFEANWRLPEPFLRKNKIYFEKYILKDQVKIDKNLLLKFFKKLNHFEIMTLYIPADRGCHICKCILYPIEKRKQKISTKYFTLKKAINNKHFKKSPENVPNPRHLALKS